MTYNSETILSNVYQDAQSQPSHQSLPSELTALLQTMAESAESQKAALGALITSHGQDCSKARELRRAAQRAIMDAL
jgi:endonuclease III